MVVQAEWLGELVAMGGIAFDSTFFVTWPAFLVLFFLVWRILLAPYQEIVEERGRLTEGTKNAAAEMTQQAESTLTRYEVKLAEARAEASRIREGLRSEAAQRQEGLLAEARAEAERLSSEGRAKLEGDIAAARAGVQREVQGISSTLVERLLGKV